jgi:hypothetical protein
MGALGCWRIGVDYRPAIWYNASYLLTEMP